MSAIHYLDAFDHEWVLEKLSAVNGNDELFQFIDGLFDPRFTLKQAGIKKQDLSYWKHEGLYENRAGAEGREWTRLSFFDYLWLRLVVELRKVNVPIKSIAQLRSQLFTMSDEDMNMIFSSRQKSYRELSLPSEIEKKIEDAITVQSELFNALFKKYFSHFSIFVLGLMLQRKRLVLSYTPDGQFYLLAPDEIRSEEQMKLFLSLSDQAHASVPLHKLMEEFFVNPFVATKEWQRVFRLTPTEVKIVEAIREKGIVDVRVKLRPEMGGYLLVEPRDRQSIEEALFEVKRIVAQGGYQNITIQLEGKSIVVFEQRAN
jgi:hypothetical protein